jgi:hypothetical protein
MWKFLSGIYPFFFLRNCFWHKTRFPVKGSGYQLFIILNEDFGTLCCFFIFGIEIRRFSGDLRLQTFVQIMKETTDHLNNIVDIIHDARKKNRKIGARLKHFYANKETIRVLLTGKGILRIDIVHCVNGVKAMNPEQIQAVADTFEIK